MHMKGWSVRACMGRGRVCSYGRVHGVCVHGEREGVCIWKGGVCVHGEREDVCIWKSLSVHAWGEGGCVHIWKV